MHCLLKYLLLYFLISFSVQMTTRHLYTETTFLKKEKMLFLYISLKNVYFLIRSLYAKTAATVLES